MAISQPLGWMRLSQGFLLLVAMPLLVAIHLLLVVIVSEEKDLKVAVIVAGVPSQVCRLEATVLGRVM